METSIQQNLNQTNNGRLIHYDLLRVFAIFCMIVLHTAARGFYSEDIHSFNWAVFNIYDSLVRFCVPIFVMISGIFYLDKSRNYTIEKLFKKSIFRIITAYIFWSFCYALVFSGIGRKGFDFTIIKSFARLWLSGWFHLWFCWMIVGLYLIVPFLRKIVESKKLCEYFLILWFVFSIVFQSTASGSLPNEGITKCLHVINTRLNMFFVLGYSGYFILGYYLHTYNLDKKVENTIYVLGVISVISVIFLTRFISLRQNAASELFYGYLILPTCFTSAAILLFFKNKISKWSFSPHQINWISVLSKYSFGIYLVHIFSLRLIYKFIAVDSFNPIFSVPIIVILAFVISFVVIYVIAKIPFFRKYIM